MADKKISGLPPAAAAAVTDQHEVNQGGVSKRLTNKDILDLVSFGLYNFDNVGVGPGPSISLLNDGSASFAGGAMVIHNDGSASFLAGAVGVDGGGNLQVGASSFINNDGSATLGGGAVQISNTGTIQTNTVFNVGGTDGLTQDFNILDGGVPKVFHFTGGILTSVT